MMPFKKEKTPVKFVSAVKKLSLTLLFLLVIAKEVADSFMWAVSRLGSTVKSRKKSKESSKATTLPSLSVKYVNSPSRKLSGSKTKIWR